MSNIRIIHNMLKKYRSVNFYNKSFIQLWLDIFLIRYDYTIVYYKGEIKIILLGFQDLLDKTHYIIPYRHLDLSDIPSNLILSYFCKELQNMKFIGYRHVTFPIYVWEKSLIKYLKEEVGFEEDKIEYLKHRLKIVDESIVYLTKEL